MKIGSLSENKDLSFTQFSMENSYFLFQVKINSKINRDAILFGLKENGIGVSIHNATPVPLMSYYRNKYGYTNKDFPNALEFAEQSISLPVHTKLNNDDIEYVCDSLIKIIKELK